MTFGNLNQNIYTAVKVYTPGQFYAAEGVVEEMFYQEVGRTKKYLRKRVGFVRSFEQVIKNLNDEAWREFHYMKAKVRGRRLYLGIAGVVKVKVNGLVALLKLITGVAIKSMV